MLAAGGVVEACVAQMSLVERLLAIPKFGDGVGLQRMLALREAAQVAVASGEASYIKVTGSNGKGSTTAMIAAMLAAAGLKTARYISPHLLRFNERISVDGVDIADRDLENGVAWLQQATAAYVRDHGATTFGAFECFTALAYRYFLQQGARHGVLEAGIGGRFDSVRVLPGSVCALTSLDLEHTHLLGDTLELIGYDKLSLCPPGGTMVLFPLCDRDLVQRLRAYAAVNQIALFECAERCQVKGLTAEVDGSRFHAEIDGLRVADVCLPLLGAHQVQNALVAMAAVKLYAERENLGWSPAFLAEAMRAGLAAVRWPGRASYVPGPPPLFYDVGHTPEATAAFLATIQPLLADQKVLLLLGVSHNKAVEAMAATLAAAADYVVCTQAYHMGAPAARVAAAVGACAPDLPCVAFTTIEAGVAHALQTAADREMTVVVAGGLFLAIEAMAVVRGEDPRALRFF